MAKRQQIAADCPFTEEQIACFNDMMYTTRMQIHSTPIPAVSGTYVRQPITPSMLKGHQRCEEMGYYADEKERIRAKIRELNDRLNELAEPNEQLTLF